MNLLDRYIHEVGRHLPRKNRSDIQAELRSSFVDTLEDRFGQDASEEQTSELLKEFGNRSEIIGNLDQMVKDMEEVVKELKQNNVSQETVQQQERILSRLLDAQRSVHRRDYSRKRLAKVGRNVVRKSPEPLRFTRSLLRDRLRRDILQMPEEGYTKEYQELIRKYFDALAKEEHR